MQLVAELVGRWMNWPDAVKLATYCQNGWVSVMSWVVCVYTCGCVCVVRALWWPAWPLSWDRRWQCRHNSESPSTTPPRLVIPVDWIFLLCVHWCGRVVGACGQWLRHGMNSASPAPRDSVCRTHGNNAWSSHPGSHKELDSDYCWCNPGRCRSAKW